MATAKKLPSGAWRTRVTKVIGDKKVTKSFTVSPDDPECRGDWKKAKRLSESRADEWALAVHDEQMMGLTVKKAIEDYIADRSKVLSPATITTYKQYVQYFEKIGDVPVEDMDTQALQKMINDMAPTVSPKTIKSRMGFFLSVLNYVGIEKRFRLRYPQALPSQRTAPDYAEIIELLNEADEIIKPAICLAAFGTMRRGEISALKQKDVSRDMCMINIHGNMVRTPDNTFVYKEIPKTTGSVRSVQLPRQVIDLLPESDDPEAFVLDLSPTRITRRFERLRNSLKLKCTFHDLRHFAASFRSDIGIPRKYIEEAGGWAKDSGVLASVYDNTLKSSRVKYANITNKYIEDNFSEAIRKRVSAN